MGNISYRASGKRGHHTGRGTVAIFSFVATIVLAAYVAITSNLLSDTKSLVTEYQQLSLGYVTELSPVYRTLSGFQAAASNGDGAADAQDGQVDAGQPPYVRQQIIDERMLEIRNAVARNDRWMAVLNPLVKSDDASNQRQLRTLLHHDSEVRASQLAINGVIGSYALPLVAAILGVCVYILRESSAKFASLSFAAREIPSYLPRFILGVVGGLLIGWFVDAGNGGGTFATISPAAVAFVVGYSVEVFFNVLDALLKALGGAARDRAAQS